MREGIQTKPVVEKILETLELCVAQQTTQQQQQGNSSATQQQRRTWLNKWLKMEITHPEIVALQSEVYNFCASYAKQPKRGHRMIIYGENGSGKSHAAKSIFKWAGRVAMNLPMVHGDSGELKLADALFFNWPMVVDGFKTGQWYVIEEMFPCSLLVLDDLGAEHDPSKIGVEKLYQIMEQRINKWTVITTNIPPESWEEKFERRIASRFLRNARHISLVNVPDFNAR
jgi:DNA replication protein DnaC